VFLRKKVDVPPNGVKKKFLIFQNWNFVDIFLPQGFSRPPVKNLNDFCRQKVSTKCRQKCRHAKGLFLVILRIILWTCRHFVDICRHFVDKIVDTNHGQKSPKTWEIRFELCRTSKIHLAVCGLDHVFFNFAPLFFLLFFGPRGLMFFFYVLVQKKKRQKSSENFWKFSKKSPGITYKFSQCWKIYVFFRSKVTIYFGGVGLVR